MMTGTRGRRDGLEGGRACEEGPQAQGARTTPGHSKRLGLGAWPPGGTRLPSSPQSSGLGPRSGLCAPSTCNSHHFHSCKDPYTAKELSDSTLNPSHRLSTALAHPAGALPAV